METVIRWAANAYAFMLPGAQIGVVIAVLIFLPMALSRRTRGASASGLLVVSYFIGVTTWLLGLTTTLASFGWLGLLLGLILAGVGVVPLGMIGAYFKLDNTVLALSLLGMAILVFALRLTSAHLRFKAANSR
jgi:hypothetical protein